MSMDLQEYVAEMVAEQATGCAGAGGYASWARQQGYPYCQVIDWTSSAGDWSFLVSKDGYEWVVMFQENNYPHQGFTRTIDETEIFYGDAEEAMHDCLCFHGLLDEEDEEYP